MSEEQGKAWAICHGVHDYRASEETPRPHPVRQDAAQDGDHAARG